MKMYSSRLKNFGCFALSGDPKIAQYVEEFINFHTKEREQIGYYNSLLQWANEVLLSIQDISRNNAIPEKDPIVDLGDTFREFAIVNELERFMEPLINFKDRIGMNVILPELGIHGTIWKDSTGKAWLYVDLRKWYSPGMFLGHEYIALPLTYDTYAIPSRAYFGTEEYIRGKSDILSFFARKFRSLKLHNIKFEFYELPNIIKGGVLAAKNSQVAYGDGSVGILLDTINSGKVLEQLKDPHDAERMLAGSRQIFLRSKNPLFIFDTESVNKRWPYDDPRNKGGTDEYHYLNGGIDIKDPALLAIWVSPGLRTYLLNWIRTWPEDEIHRVFGERNPGKLIVSSVEDLGVSDAQSVSVSIKSNAETPSVVSSSGCSDCLNVINTTKGALRKIDELLAQGTEKHAEALKLVELSERYLYDHRYKEVIVQSGLIAQIAQRRALIEGTKEGWGAAIAKVQEAIDDEEKQETTLSGGSLGKGDAISPSPDKQVYSTTEAQKFIPPPLLSESEKFEKYRRDLIDRKAYLQEKEKMTVKRASWREMLNAFIRHLRLSHGREIRSIQLLKFLQRDEKLRKEIEGNFDQSRISEEIEPANIFTPVNNPDIFEAFFY